jgi:hypothetical protein
MAQKKPHVALLFFRRKPCDPQVDESSYFDIEVLLSQRAAFQFEDASSKPQSFFRGMQIFPGGKLEDDDINPWQRAYLELREEGGQRLCDWLDAILKADSKRLLQVDEHCFAIEVCPNDDLNGEREFVNLIKLAPEHRSVGWYSTSAVAEFEDLAPHKNRVPEGIKAIFADEAWWIKQLAELVSQEG